MQNLHNRRGDLGGGLLHKISDESAYERIISLENLLGAWKEFKRGKTRKPDVQEFDAALEENLFEIHDALKTKTYRPAPYVSFFISDPKRRSIHKACVRDRVVHQALFRVLYPVFNKTFIHDSYSCRLGKGTHCGVRQLARYLRVVSGNHHRTAYALKCDIRKFFENIDHGLLVGLIEKRVCDVGTRWLIREIIDSFSMSKGSPSSKVGLPLGNVTSQLFSNIYLNEFDQWAKHTLKARYYLRYCDDFIILHSDADYLRGIVPLIQKTLHKKLKLALHPHKVSITKIRQGVDFLGYVTLPHATMVRTVSKNRMFRKLQEKKKLVQNGTITEESFNHSRQSYLGVLAHANAQKLREQAKAL